MSDVYHSVLLKHLQPHLVQFKKMLRYWLVGSILIFLVCGYDYLLNYERLELAYYDKSLVKDSYFLFRKYNRTNFCLNVSFHLLKDLDGNNLKFTTRMYQLLSGQYKPNGMERGLNVCEYWKRNLFGTTEHLAQYGNLEGCDIKKGHYYLYNYMPDESKLPKYIPFGNFMIEMDVVFVNTEQPLLKFQWYLNSKLKLKNRVIGG